MKLSMIEQKKIEADVLVIGGGLAGCFAAIKAAEKGVKVVVFDKGNIKRSGNGATGLHRIPLIHPEYNYTYNEFARLNLVGAQGIADEDICYAFGSAWKDFSHWGGRSRVFICKTHWKQGAKPSSSKRSSHPVLHLQTNPQLRFRIRRTRLLRCLCDRRLP